MLSQSNKEGCTSPPSPLTFLSPHPPLLSPAPSPIAPPLPIPHPFRYDINPQCSPPDGRKENLCIQLTIEVRLLADTTLNWMSAPPSGSGSGGGGHGEDNDEDIKHRTLKHLCNIAHDVSFLVQVAPSSGSI